MANLIGDLKQINSAIEAIADNKTGKVDASDVRNALRSLAGAYGDMGINDGPQPHTIYAAGQPHAIYFSSNRPPDCLDGIFVKEGFSLPTVTLIDFDPVESRITFSSPHVLVDGDPIVIVNSGDPALNGAYRVDIVDPTTISIPTTGITAPIAANTKISMPTHMIISPVAEGFFSISMSITAELINAANPSNGIKLYCFVNDSSPPGGRAEATTTINNDPTNMSTTFCASLKSGDVVYLCLENPGADEDIDLDDISLFIKRQGLVL